MNAAEYCREIESYLCRKNDGHLIRIVGPAFEQVCGWAARGVPLKIVYEGIDRYFARYYAKGPRRRPVRIEFCEADVLDTFDAWRRAVGVTAAREDPRGGPTGTARGGGRRPSLSAHLNRVGLKLTTLAGRQEAWPGQHALIDELLREVDFIRAAGRQVRREARARLLARLEGLDRRLLAAVREAAAAPILEEARRAAAAELAGFRERMAPDAFALACERAVDRLLRDRFDLPRLAMDV